MRLPLLLASVARVAAEPCTIEAKLLAVASRHIDLHIRSVDANGTRRDVWGELTFHCSLLTKNGTELLPELRVTWEDVGLVNVWVRGLIDLRGRLVLEVSHAPDGCTEATGTFDLELTGSYDDFVPEYVVVLNFVSIFANAGVKIFGPPKSVITVDLSSRGASRSPWAPGGPLERGHYLF